MRLFASRTLSRREQVRDGACCEQDAQRQARECEARVFVPNAPCEPGGCVSVYNDIESRSGVAWSLSLQADGQYSYVINEHLTYRSSS